MCIYVSVEVGYILWLFWLHRLLSCRAKNSGQRAPSGYVFRTYVCMYGYFFSSLFFISFCLSPCSLSCRKMRGTPASFFFFFFHRLVSSFFSSTWYWKNERAMHTPIDKKSWTPPRSLIFSYTHIDILLRVYTYLFMVGISVNN